MTINHHPSDELLMDYASGGAGESWGLAIATHLALCPRCRHVVSELEAVGGGLLDEISPEPMADNALDTVLARLDNAVEDINAPRPSPPTSGSKPVLPQPLRAYVGGDVDELSWQRLGLGAFQLLIPTENEGTTVRLLRIPAGRLVPEHSHRGLELTLVLAGAFSDATGHYGKGDFQEADESVEHQPHAAPNDDCICLAVTEAPLRFKSIVTRLVQPLLGI